MAVSLLTRQVSDLCLGKPALRPLSVTATVAEALSALKRLGETSLSLWTFDHSDPSAAAARCVGKVSVGDVICFLAAEENLNSPASALQAPLSALLPKVPGLIRHLEPNTSLLEAIDVILEGAQNLVIPIQTRKSNKFSSRNKNQTLQKDLEYCWITQEDIIRYLLNCIGLFSPTPASPIASLGLVEAAGSVFAVRYDAAAVSALPLIAQSIARQTSVAVVDGEGRLVGEISPLAFNSCDESVAAAIATLTAGDLMAYVGCGGPPEDLVQLVKDKLEERNCVALLDWIMEEDCSTISSSSSLCSSSSDEEFGSGKSGGGGGGRLGGSSARAGGRRSEQAIVCHPWSSLAAVMIQALAHRSGYVWVVEEDGALSGIVTLAGMLKVFRERLNSM